MSRFLSRQFVYHDYLRGKDVPQIILDAYRDGAARLAEAVAAVTAAVLPGTRSFVDDSVNLTSPSYTCVTLNNVLGCCPIGLDCNASSFTATCVPQVTYECASTICCCMAFSTIVPISDL